MPTEFIRKLTPTSNLVVPATAEETFDAWKLLFVYIDNRHNVPILKADVQRCKTDGEGRIQTYETRSVVLSSNLLTDIDTHGAVSSGVESFLKAIEKIGQSKNQL